MSVYASILAAVKDRLASIPALSSVPIRLRKRPFFSAEHGDSPPAGLVCPMTERVAKLHMAGGVWMDYEVLVVLVQAQGATLQDPVQLAWQLDRREEVRLAVFKPSLAGVSSVFDVSYEPSPAFDLSALDQLFDVSAQLFTFRSAEAR